MLIFVILIVLTGLLIFNSAYSKSGAVETRGFVENKLGAACHRPDSCGGKIRVKYFRMAGRGFDMVAHRRSGFVCGKGRGPLRLLEATQASEGHKTG